MSRIIKREMKQYWRAILFLWEIISIVHILRTEGLPTSSDKFKFQIGYYEVPLDHFSFATNKTFQMKYLFNDTWWDKSNGPIFFYTGNEGDIELFAQNAGFMWDIANEFHALLLFAEHRYYGTSLPFGNDSFSSPEKVGYLTSEQALADFADFLQYFRYHSANGAPVISFGGSYGGMLTAWMRIKYPHVVQGAIAASAPILQFTGITPCGVYSNIITTAFENESKECSQTIRKSWEYINSFTETVIGRDWLKNNWKLCKPIESEDDVAKLKDWLNNVYSNLAMINYPYENNFLEPVPAHVVKVFCEQLFDSTLPSKNLMRALFKGLNVYFNYTGNSPCLDIHQDATKALGVQGWDYQACTEMIMPMCNDGIHDFFEPSPWNYSEYSETCRKKYSVVPRPWQAEIIYGGKHLSAASNIVFSNGKLDPWSGGGVLQNISETVLAIIIPEGAHHLDLRSANPHDPDSVIFARNFEKAQIRKWLKEFKEAYKNKLISHNI